MDFLILFLAVFIGLLIKDIILFSSKFLYNKIKKIFFNKDKKIKGLNKDIKRLTDKRNLFLEE